MTERKMTRERRWIILGEDGRHVTVGRHSDPTNEELARAADVLRATEQGGWLAVMEGVYYSCGIVSLMQVRQLVPSHTDWQTAVQAFKKFRLSHK
jgi:hypothetical protein